MSSELKDSYIPKDATQHNEFIKKYPKYDGRGLVIAILDSSIDVSVDGLQKTSTGLPKIIDCYDFTGFGHVDTSTVKEMDSKNVVIGLSGTELKIPSKWKNPSGKWHLGLKSLYELCPDAVLEKIIKERKAAIEKQNTTIKQKFSKQFKEKGEANYDALREYLQSTENLSKNSLVADCIVWFDGKNWLACIDASLTGYLEKRKVLKNFCDGHEYGIIGCDLAYCVNIYNDGNLLEIYTPYDSHGTGVSYVAAAHCPGVPKKDGLAPGAQIVPMTVLDSQRGGRQCKYALRNALLKCIEQKVDIVNCSVTTFFEDNEDLINEMTEKHGIIITKSAANYGPVYSSVFEFDGLYKNVFVVGAVTNKYEDAEIPYYSSHGPSSDGSRGITFVAPVNSTVAAPRFFSVKEKSATGTSAAAPFVAGSVACLISALKANSMEYSAGILKVAISKTAFLPKHGDRLAYGHGILQILAAFEFLKNCRNSMIQEFLKLESGLKFKNDTNNGILLKFGGKETVEIIKTLDDKNIKLELITKFSDRFITSIKNNVISVKIDTKVLQPGTASYAEIHGISFSKLLFNPVLHYPITIILPQKVTKDENYCIKRDIVLNPNTPNRLFVSPPKYSFQCVLRLNSAVEISELIYFQWGIGYFTTPGKWLRFHGKNTTQTFQIPVYYDNIHELSLMSYKCTKPLNFNVEYTFYGVNVTRPLSTKNSDENSDQKSEPADQNIIEFSNYFENLTASLSLKFKQISYTLIPINACNEAIKNIYAHLSSGKYVIIACVLNSNSEIDILHSLELLPTITVTIELSKPVEPALYYPFDATTNIKENELTEFKYQVYKMRMDDISAKNVPKLLSSNTILQGTLYFKNENTNLELPISHDYSFNIKENDKENSRDLSCNSLKKLFDSLSVNDTLKIQGENMYKKDSAKDTPHAVEKAAINKNKAKSKLSRRKQKKNYIHPITDPLCLIQAVNYENEILKNPESNMSQSKTSDLQKDIAQIKQALAAEHFGKALLYLNKLSTKHQTNPAFKVIDLAIIEILKHLKWDHLVKAHQHALLDRRRDYYRLF